MYAQLNNAWLYFVTNIMSYDSINLIFIINKLTKPNYVDWKRNLDIVLTFEEIVHFTPNEHSTQEKKDNYYSWQIAE